jgi:hypothetical protein
MNSVLCSIGSFRHLALIRRLALIVAFLGIASAAAEQPRLHILWDTVSPDGKYAIAWSATGDTTPDLSAPPSETDKSPVANYLIEVATGKLLLQLPECHYWDSYAAGHQNHFSLETGWLEGSQSLLAIYNSRWSTDAALLVDVSLRRAVSIKNQLEASFKEALKSTRGKDYTKYKDSLAIEFGSPWFVAPGQFYVSGNASIPKKESPNFNLGLFFKVANDGIGVILAKFETSSHQESADRSLNRVYRKLQGLLSSDDRKILIEEERTWLTKRDAIRSEQHKAAFIEARRQELQTRLASILEAREER